MQELEYRNVDAAEPEATKTFEIPTGSQAVKLAVEAAPGGWVLVKIGEQPVYMTTAGARELAHALSLVASQVAGAKTRKRHK